MNYDFSGLHAYWRRGMLLLIGVLCVAATVCAGPSEILINLDVKDMNILDVLRLLATQGQVNIVASRTVQGRVTAKLDNVTIQEALDAILETNNLVYKESKGIYKVFSAQDIMQQEQTEIMLTQLFVLKHAKITPEMRQVFNSIKSARGRVEMNTLTNQIVVTDTQDVLNRIAEMINNLDTPLETKIVNLNYASASELHTKLMEILPRESGDVFVDERTNSLVIRAIPETLAQLLPMVENWDRRAMQVLIEARIYEISADNTMGFGVSWDYQQGGDNAVSASSSLPLSITSGGTLKVGTLSADEYNVTIQALDSMTNTDILSNPRIVVANNKEANILVGSSEPYQVVFLDKETNTQTEETRFIDVGVKLLVTPQISEDDYITMNIHPEVSSARRVAEVNNALAVDTTQADTTVVVKNGRTIVLGGLMKETDTEKVVQIPLLGKLPLMGALFRSKLNSKVKKEVVVFITPYILHNETGSFRKQERENAMKHALEEAEKKWQVWEEREYDESVQ